MFMGAEEQPQRVFAMQTEEQSGLQVRAELIKVHREFMETRTKLKSLEKRHKLLMKLDREYNPKPPQN